MPLLDQETQERARELLREAEHYADFMPFPQFGWAVVKLLALIIDALSKDGAS